MTRPEYVEFLGDALGNATRVSRDGAVHFECCDWRHVTEFMEAGRLAYCETLNTGRGTPPRACVGTFEGPIFWNRFVIRDLTPPGESSIKFKRLSNVERINRHR